MQTCKRCSRNNVYSLDLCNSCYTQYSRLRRNKYGNAPAFTVERFMQLHPMRVNRVERRMEKDKAHKDFLVNGFLISGSKTRELAKRVKALALAVDHILITGETGVGKEDIAQALHQLGSRQKKEFVSVNSATLGPLADSELFGHLPGSFTGAKGHSLGLIQTSNGGTLFLDEIESLPLEVQGKLLRTLESGEVRPVGASHSVHVDLRIVAATNLPLRSLINEKQFRHDLFYRFTHTVDVLPLRERKEEIPFLATHFVREEVAVRNPSSKIHISGEAMQKLCVYDWPGNVRELRNVIKQAVFELTLQGKLGTKKTPTIRLKHLPESVRSFVTEQSSVHSEDARIITFPDRTK